MKVTPNADRSLKVLSLAEESMYIQIIKAGELHVYVNIFFMCFLLVFL